MTTSKIKAILCMNTDGCIGKDGDLLYRIKRDLQRFKELTKDQMIVMGRKTADSLPKPLPNRTNIVVSRTEYVRDGFFWVPSFSELLKSWFRTSDIWVIGGAEFIKAHKDLIEEWHITIVYDTKKGDTYIDGGLAFFSGMRGFSESIHVEDDLTFEFAKFIPV